MKKLIATILLVGLVVTSFTSCDTIGNVKDKLFDLISGSNRKLDEKYLKDLNGADWLADVNVEDIASVKTIHGYTGYAPGGRDIIRKTTDSEVIKTIVEQYRSVEISPLTREQTMVNGGTIFSITFEFVDGSVKRFSLNNSIFWDGNGNPYKLVGGSPKLTDDMNIEKRYRFDTSYKGIAYQKDEYGQLVPVGEVNIRKLEFVKADDPTGDVGPLKLIIKTEFGELRFFDGIVIAKGKYYQLAEGTVYDLVNTDGVTELINAYELKHGKDSAPLIRYYGKYSSGAVVGMFADCNTENEWSETIDYFTFNYNNGNRIVILYDGEFYTLGKAYEEGYITRENLRVVKNIYNYKF